MFYVAYYEILKKILTPILTIRELRHLEGRNTLSYRAIRYKPTRFTGNLGRL